MDPSLKYLIILLIDPSLIKIFYCSAILVVTSRRIFNNFRAEMDRTELDRFGPTRCGPVDDVIIGSRKRD